LAIVAAGPWLLGIVINPSTGMTSLRIEVGLDAPGAPEDAIIAPERDSFASRKPALRLPICRDNIL
jgi:hypothetical protein